jgi:PAS domain S-box-containing protein
VEITARIFSWQGRDVHICAIRDITESIRYREELERERTFLRKVIDSSPDFIFVTDPRGTVLMCNQAFSELHQKPLEEMIGRSLYEVMRDTAIIPVVRQEIEDILNGRVSQTYRETLVEDGSGDHRWIRAVKAPMRDAEGQVERFIGIGTDITAQVRNREEMERQRRFLQSVLDQSPNFIYVLDRDDASS